MKIAGKFLKNASAFYGFWRTTWRIWDEKRNFQLHLDMKAVRAETLWRSLVDVIIVLSWSLRDRVLSFTRLTTTDKECKSLICGFERKVLSSPHF